MELPKSAESRVGICVRYLGRFSNVESTNALSREVELAFEELVPHEYSGIYLFNEKTEKLELVIAHGFTEEERLEAEVTAMERHPGMVYRSGETLYISDTEDKSQPISIDSKRSFKVRCRLYQPIVSKNKIIGVFGIVSSRPDAFSSDDKELFKFICDLAGQVYTRLVVESAEKEAQEIQRKLSVIATHTDNAVIITDAAGKIEWVNDAFTQMAGYELHEIEGKIPGKFLQGSQTDLEEVSKIGAQLKKKEKVESTLINYSKSGQPYTVNLQIFPVFNEQRQHTHFISIQRDVTVLEQNRRKIEEQRSRLSAIISTIPDQLVVFNENGVIEEFYSNDSFLSEAEKEKIIGVKLQDLVGSSQAEPILQAVEKVLTGEHIETIEIKSARSDKPRDLELRFTLLAKNRILALVREITARKEQEMATKRALEIVSEQNKRLLNFSYIVSHNIRSHSSNITGIAQILADNPDPEIQAQFTDGLLKSSKNLDSTLRHLNELLNIQSRINIHKESVSLIQVVTQTLESLVVDLNANNILIENKIPDGFKFFTDKAYLDSIVLNLISNAIKYRDPEKKPVITIRAGFRNQVPYFYVEDNGKGIDMEKYGSKLFGMFKTFHGNKDARGIGLFITRNQIESLGGAIEVESELGKGTRFIVSLP
jgi:PAS domain S-box-containing protein